MVFSPRTIRVNGPLCIFLLGILACAPSPHFYLRYGDQLTQTDLDKILAENPLPATQNIKVATPTFPQPSVALAVFTPPFDGKDTIPVKSPSGSTKR